ncbi:condensation domain-containing protein [Stackebrandtia nassauensis]|uniref:Condensation domain protein n=1 Tax=Stackebrandtia nassauensis (strain DSM 44728 / CIP 108903 / NRRL B-16338 / NBRC 102104 / LLR-40K-21) TaxID=446470 RepID=D3PVQ5_STANL|nr:condensation domain-containing protein [Stackebrandtia nassauensis]ADD43169.1 condensation domain protein [Stackebrandtia nassauensis DSM 44728]
MERGLTQAQRYSLTWLRDQRELGTDVPANMIVMPIRFRTRISDRQIQTTIGRLVERHESLRTGFCLHTHECGPVTFVQKGISVSVKVRRVNDTSMASDDVASAIDEIANTRLPLSQPPLLTTRILRAGFADVLVLVGVDHLVFDGASATPFFDEFVDLLANPATALPPARQFADWIAWQRTHLDGPAGKELLDYWRGTLGEAGPMPRLNVPTDPDSGRTSMQTHAVRVSSVTPECLRTVDIKETVTPFMVAMNVVARACAHVLDLPDLVIHTPTANRGSMAAKGVIGWLAHSMPVRVRIGSRTTFRQSLSQVRRAVLGAITHSDMPLLVLHQHLRPDTFDDIRLGRIYFAYEKPSSTVRRFRESTAELYTVPGGYASSTVGNGITIVVTEFRDHLAVRAVAQPDIATPILHQLIDRIEQEFGALDRPKESRES